MLLLLMLFLSSNSNATLPSQLCKIINSKDVNLALECAGTISDGYFNPLALDICEIATQKNTHDGIACLKSVKENIFQKSAIETCKAIVAINPELALKCINTISNKGFANDSSSSCRSITSSDLNLSLKCLELTGRPLSNMKCLNKLEIAYQLQKALDGFYQNKLTESSTLIENLKTHLENCN